MAGLDPEDDEAAPSTNATDASSSPVHDAWQSWTSNPANNAALLQFGIAMLQPRSPGQSGIGAAANALAEGGGAAGRVIEKTKEEEDRESKEATAVAERAAKTQTAASGAVTAAAYGRSVDNAGSTTTGKGALQNAMKIQASLRSWALKPEDPISVQLNGGASNDPVVQALQRAHPDIKTKADILSNPIYMKEAGKLLGAAQASAPADDSEDDGTGTPTPVAAASAATPAVRTIYKDGKPYSWDGVNAPVPIQK